MSCLNSRRSYYYFPFRQTNGRHIVILLPVCFRFAIWSYTSLCHAALHNPTKFCRQVTTHAKVITFITQILLRPQEAHPWAETRVLAYRSSLSVKKCDLGPWRRKRKKERNSDVWSHVCAQTTHVELPTKVVMWGGVTDVVNRIKFCQNWLRALGSLRGLNLPYSYA